MSESQATDLPEETVRPATWRRVVTTLAGTLLAVIVATVGAAAYRSWKDRMRQHAPDIHFTAPFRDFGQHLRHRYISLYTMNSDTAERDEYRFDANGARLDRHNVSVARPYEFRHIWFLGNSAGQGLGLREQETVTAQLNELLAANDMPWRAVNLAQGGFTSHQELLLLIELLQDGHQPDAVIHFSGIVEHPGSGNWEVGTPRAAHVGDMILNRRRLQLPHFRPLESISQPWQDVGADFRLWLHAAERGQSPESADPLHYDGDWHDATHRYLTNLNVMKGLLDQMDVPAYFVFQPLMEYELHYQVRELSDFERSALTKYMHTNEHDRRECLYDPRHRDLRERLGTSFHDYYDVFRGHDGETLYVDPRHPNGRANAILAQRLFQDLQPLWGAGPRETSPDSGPGTPARPLEIAEGTASSNSQPAPK